MERIPKTRASLILRLPSAADASAWAEFTEIYEPFVFRFARRRGLQDADAYELTQEVFLAVAKSIRRFEIDPQRAQFRTWLFRIAKNCVLKLLAKRQRAMTLDSATWERVAAAVPQTDQSHLETEQAYRRDVFLWAAARVRKQVRAVTWQAFSLTCLMDQSVEQAAESLGVSRGAIYVAKSRVLHRLRLEVQQLEGEIE